MELSYRYSNNIYEKATPYYINHLFINVLKCVHILSLAVCSDCLLACDPTCYCIYYSGPSRTPHRYSYIKEEDNVPHTQCNWKTCGSYYISSHSLTQSVS